MSARVVPMKKPFWDKPQPAWLDEDDMLTATDGANAEHPYTAFRAEQPTRERAAVDEAGTKAWAERVTLVPPEWFTEAPPVRKWLLRDKRKAEFEGLLPLGKASQLVAEGGGGKTTLVMQLALCVASGADWLGTFSVASPGRVLLLLGEEDAEEVRRRLYGIARTLKFKAPEPDRIVVLPLSGMPCSTLAREKQGNAVETPFLGWLRTYLAGGEWSLIVLDPQARFAGPDAEVDNAAGTRFVEVAESLCALTGATTLVSHHTNKTSRGVGVKVSGISGRGSTSLYDGFRWVASLEVQRSKLEGAEEQDRLGEVIKLSFDKSNYSRRADPLLLRRADGGALVPLDEADADIIAKAQDGSVERASKTATRKNERAAERAGQELAVITALARAWPAGVEAAALRAAVTKDAVCGVRAAEEAIAGLATHYADNGKGRRPRVRTLKPETLPAELRAAAIAANPRTQT